jgi:hypothetical protein
MLSCDYTFTFRLAFRPLPAADARMSQSTLDGDELFGEAATEMRTDVENSLAAARDAMPAPEALWEVEADNTLGALNGLRSALDVEEARDDLRDAKKWYTMGERAGAFDDGADLAESIAAVEELLADVEEAREQVGELASTVPALKSQLEDAGEETEPAPDADADGSGAEA